MKFGLLFLSVFLFFGSLRAMDTESESVRSVHPKITYREIDDIQWDKLNKFIQAGYELGAQQLGIPFGNFHSFKVAGDLEGFKADFISFFKDSRSKLSVRKSNFKALFSYFYNYVNYAYQANDAFIRHDVVAEGNLGVPDRSSALKNKGERQESFAELQVITNHLFRGLTEFYIYTFTDPRGVIPATETGSIGYSMDENGYVPFPVLNENYNQVVNVNWGIFDPEHQGNIVVRKDTVQRESGLLLEVMNNNRLKVRGYNGEQSPHSFTAHKTTASTLLSPENNLLNMFVGLLPFEVLNGTQRLRENEVVFVPVPTVDRDWQMVELLFLEEIQSEPNGNQPEVVNCLLDNRNGSVEDYKSHILSEYEARIKEEQLQRSKLVEEGKIEGRKGKGKGKKKKGKAKGKGKSKGKSQASSGPKPGTVKSNESYSARVLFEKHKVECRTKFRDLLKILSNIVREIPEQVKATVSMQGSHINIHGENAGFTIVRPHGSKSDIPPYLVNRIINNLLIFIQDQ